MKNNIFLTTLVAAIVSFGIIYFTPLRINTSVTTAASVPTESALERIKRTGIVRCGYTPWPPFWEVDPNTNISKGLTKELSDKFFSLAGWKPEYIEVASGADVQDLKSGKIDMMCGAGPWYIGALKEINYSHPYYYGAVYVWARNDETRFTDLNAINSPDAHFVGLDGDLSIDLVQRLFPQAKIQTLNGLTDPAQMMLNVATRKADLIIIDKISVSHFNDNNDTKLKSLFPDQPIAIYGGGFAVKKGEPDLLETINGLVDMMNNMSIPDRLINAYGLGSMGLLPPAKPYK